MFFSQVLILYFVPSPYYIKRIGDCLEFNMKYPGCEIVAPSYFLGNGHCDYITNNAECKFDGGTYKLNEDDTV